MAYLTGLVSSAEVLPVVRQQRDKMLSRVAIGALQVIPYYRFPFVDSFL